MHLSRVTVGSESYGFHSLLSVLLLERMGGAGGKQMKRQQPTYGKLTKQMPKTSVYAWTKSGDLYELGTIRLLYRARLTLEARMLTKQLRADGFVIDDSEILDGKEGQ